MIKNEMNNSIFAFKIMVLCLSFLMVSALIAPQNAFANSKYASVVMDADTGMILHQRYANKVLHPASLTKVMTLLLTFEAIQRGDLSLRERIRISTHAESMIPSKIGLPAGSSIRVRDAIYALVTKSANDVAVALAERLGGTEYNFAKMMTKRARELGMSRTTFRNASGLHHRRQVSTARDMAKLARYVIQTHPQEYEYFSKTSFRYRGKTYRNHNKLLKSYTGMDGMKTGYIKASGFNLIASAVRNERRIIGVVFGGRSGKTRNAHMRKLLDRGFAHIETIRVASIENAPLPPRKPGILVAMANLNKLKPAAGHDEDDITTTSSRWSMLNPVLQSSFGRLIGEGDYDPAISKRLETGLLALAAHQKEPRSDLLKSYKSQILATQGQMAFKNNIKTGNLYAAAPSSAAAHNWAIQIGAFNSRVASDKAIHKGLSKLPAHLQNATPSIVPLKTASGYLFRARLNGFDETAAQQACEFFRECILVTMH